MTARPVVRVTLDGPIEVWVDGTWQRAEVWECDSGHGFCAEADCDFRCSCGWRCDGGEAGVSP